MLFIIFFELFSKKDKNSFLLFLLSYALEAWDDLKKLWKLDEDAARVYYHAQKMRANNLILLVIQNFA